MSENIIDQVKTAFIKILNEIDETSHEFDIRGRIIIHLIRNVLGYSGKEYQDEKNRTDITIFDENNFRVVVIETKKMEVDIDTKELKDYAFKYADQTTKYIGLSNGRKFKLWEVIDCQNDILRINLDFQFKTLDETKNKKELLFFENLKKSILWDESKYAEFESYYGKIEIVPENNEGFDKLVEKLDYIINQILMEYVLSTFDAFQNKYQEYLIQNGDLEKNLKNVKNNKPLLLHYTKEKKQLEIKYQKYLSFKGYELWKIFSNREESDEDINKDIFCKETIYVMLNKLLFIRICEDKEILPMNISNGGIDILKSRLIDPEESYKEILDIAYNTAGKLYSHFYELGILDWYMEGDDDLNKVLNRVLWILNRFNFKKIDKDILGKLYQKYLPIDERKRFGEFYTPDVIIDYILDSIDYKKDQMIEGKDFLDPACGSGGFLVRVINQLIEKYKNKGLPSEEILNNAIEHVYGFDINPFACHISEMNLLFQVIELYSEVRTVNKGFKMKRFNIYQTDSLLVPKEFQDMLKYLSNGKAMKYIDEGKKIVKLKKKKFDYIAMNPPYVHQKGKRGKPKISIEYRQYLKKYYKTVYNKDIKTKGGIKINLFVPFVELCIKNIKANNKCGFIVHKNLLKVESYKILRKFILDNCKIHKIVDLGYGVFEDVTGEMVIIILHKESDKLKRENNKISVLTNFRNREDLNIGNFDSYEIIQETFNNTIDNIFTIYMDAEFQDLRKKIEKNTIPLIKAVNIISNGFNIKKGNTINKKKNKFYKKSIRGKDIGRYYIKKHDRYAYYHSSVITRKGDEKTFKAPEKLVMQRIGGEFIATYDNEQIYCFNSVNMLVPKNEKYDLKYILAILNSHFMNFYFKKRFSSFADYTSNITQGYLEPLPIHVPNKQEMDGIVVLVNGILSLYKKYYRNNEIMKNFRIILEKYPIIKISEHPLVSFNLTDNILKIIKLENNIIHLSPKNQIRGSNKFVAKYIYYWLKCYENDLKKSKNLKNELMKIKIPKDITDIRSVLVNYEAIKDELSELPLEIKNVEENINKAIYSLYKLSEEEIKLIKSYLH